MLNWHSLTPTHYCSPPLLPTLQDILPLQKWVVRQLARHALPKLILQMPHMIWRISEPVLYYVGGLSPSPQNKTVSAYWTRGMSEFSYTPSLPKTKSLDPFLRCICSSPTLIRALLDSTGYALPSRVQNMAILFGLGSPGTMSSRGTMPRRFVNFFSKISSKPRREKFWSGAQMRRRSSKA